MFTKLLQYLTDVKVTRPPLALFKVATSSFSPAISVPPSLPPITLDRAGTKDTPLTPLQLLLIHVFCHDIVGGGTAGSTVAPLAGQVLAISTHLRGAPRPGMLVVCIVPDTLVVNNSIVGEREDTGHVGVVATVRGAGIGWLLTAIVLLVVVSSKLFTVVTATH